jgi:2-polyprenyl-3-methyl-5-hydroxy-6-metoxy-1,4-benzoquinol methylase
MELGNFINTFLNCIKPGDNVLDLGAGEGNFAQMFLDRGAIVTAVDKQPPAFQDANLTVKKIRIEDFCASADDGQYNLVFARNVIQFLDKSWVYETLFPWIDKHLAKDGIVAIETFYQNPEPAFDRPMHSLYMLNELTSYFMTWKDLHAEEYGHLGFDMSGQTRKFFISSLIVQKIK